MKPREPKDGDLSFDGGKTWASPLVVCAAKLLIAANAEVLEIAKRADGPKAFSAALEQLWGKDTYRRKLHSAYVRAHKQLGKKNAKRD